MSAPPVRRRLTAGAATAFVAIGLSIVDSSVATATATVSTAAAAAASTGYVRLAHLSPDTPAVDVYLSSPSGAIETKVFPAVPYGVVSDYLRVPTGAYAVAMRAVGAPADSAPVLTTQVSVAEGKAYTVAGVGRHADLGLRVIEDDITLPPNGRAKVRIVQASVRAPVLSVTTSSGESVASDVAFATATPYQQVAPGRWTLTVQPNGGGQASTLQADLTSGNVYSLIVLDAQGGGLRAELRTDARRLGGVPLGGMDTGGGGSSRTDPQPNPMLVSAVAVLLCAGVLTGMRLRRVRARQL